MFRTEILIAPATDQLPRTARVLTMGSCFADSIGSRLAANKVETLVNPFGTVFQPLALARLLRAAAGEEVDWQQHLVQARGRWQSYDLHGSIGADSPVDLLQQIQALVQRTGDFLRQADVVLLTLGTAWTYRLRETGELVNNCHKQPADLFVRELLTPDEIINGLAEMHAYLRRINPNLRFVLTVSPVRHLKETLPLNSVSKSVLRIATHIVSDLLPGVAYFPAYELLVDDLRDYRFYAADMLHPSEVAEDYIWDKFARTYFDVDFGRFRKEWASVRQSLGHRPLHSGAPEHRLFLESTLLKLEQLSLRKVAVDDELREVRAQLAALPVPPQPEPEEAIEDDEERIDIGVDAEQSENGMATNAPSAFPNPAPATPRLSPEEFRSQRGARSGRSERGRRDGRGKGQTTPAENEQFQSPAVFAEASAEIQSVENTLSSAQKEFILVEDSLEAPNISSAQGLEVVSGEEPVKKKKRRSRGGAKRTARKHALRMAAGETLPTTSLPLDEGAIAAANSGNNAPTQRTEGKKSSVITKSVPVPRGGRRQDQGQARRAPLFASPVNAAPAADMPADAAAPAPEPMQPAVELPTIFGGIAPVESEVSGQSSRRNRNRGKKAPEQAAVYTTPNEVTDASGIQPESPVIGTAEQLSGSTSDAADTRPAQGRGKKGKPAAVPVAAEVPAVPEAPATVTPPTVAPARRNSRAKRAVSGARAEKPAVDIPVIPVPDETQVRTQVAAGRMTGSSATLIEDAAKPLGFNKKPAEKKPIAPKKPAAKATKAASKPVADVPAAPAPALPDAPAAPAPKRKPAAKPKAPAAKSAAPKPKAPKKPTKPA